MKRWIGITSFVLVLLLCGVGPVWKLYAQATTGFTKVNTTPITTTSFTSGTLTDGVMYEFEVTAVNLGGESKPSTIVSGMVPATGTHVGTLTWVASVGADSYNVYNRQVIIPNPPGAVSLTIN